MESTIPQRPHQPLGRHGVLDHGPDDLLPHVLLELALRDSLGVFPIPFPRALESLNRIARRAGRLPCLQLQDIFLIGIAVYD
jgi:hypothetical protein